MTVDRAHVLATPGMDAHSSYVGLFRHRDGMELHYGRDDFAGERELARALSQDRSKDMRGKTARTSHVSGRTLHKRHFLIIIHGEASCTEAIVKQSPSYAIAIGALTFLVSLVFNLRGYHSALMGGLAAAIAVGAVYWAGPRFSGKR